MRPSTIKDNQMWKGTTRIVMAPPDGDLTNDKIRPLEMLHEFKDGVNQYHARCILEEGDLELLKNGGVVWISFYDHVVPFCLTVAEKE